jgi:hypothetical protein
MNQVGRRRNTLVIRRGFDHAMKRAAYILIGGLLAAAAIAPLNSGRAGPAAHTSPVSIGAFADPPDVTISGTEAFTLIASQFRMFDPDFAAHRERYLERVHEAARTLAARERQGDADLTCSRQIYLEVKWMVNYTADWPLIRQRLDDLAHSLTVADQRFATEQLSSGAWGACYTRNFKRLEATISALEMLYTAGTPPTHAIVAFDTVGSTADLRRYLESLVVSDIAAAGVNQRAQLNSVITSLGRATLKKYMLSWLETETRGLLWSADREGVAAVRQTVSQFVDDWQDPVTGFWGAWYRSGDEIYRTSDLSMTFHIVSYRKGDVNHRQAIGRHLLQMKYQPYPFGWLKDGRQSNHNNYDVVKIARLLWNDFPPEVRAQLSDEIDYMVEWALRGSLQRDGSVAFDGKMFESTAQEYYYLAAFLGEAEVFADGRPFWADDDNVSERHWDFGSRICRYIKTRFDSLRLDGSSAWSARDRLARHCSDKA